MKRFHRPVKDLAWFLYRWIAPVFDPRKAAVAVLGYPRYFKDLSAYRHMAGAEQLALVNLYPILDNKTSTTTFDKHYFYQDTWAFERILEQKPSWHVDIGSRVDFIGFLATVTNVLFVEIRPLQARLPRLHQVQGDILKLPFADNSVASLSCLHVAEHVGLGRYGDKLDPQGTQKACQELARVLARGGDLYFALPVGKPRLCFNAHRVHSPLDILRYFRGLDLIELSAVNDEGDFVRRCDLAVLTEQSYACGLFHFKKPTKLPR